MIRDEIIKEFGNLNININTNGVIPLSSIIHTVIPKGFSQPQIEAELYAMEADELIKIITLPNGVTRMIQVLIPINNNA